MPLLGMALLCAGWAVDHLVQINKTGGTVTHKDDQGGNSGSNLMQWIMIPGIIIIAVMALRRKK